MERTRTHRVYVCVPPLHSRADSLFEGTFGSLRWTCSFHRTHIQPIELPVATGPFFAACDFQFCVELHSVSHPSLFARRRVSPISFDQCVRWNGFVICLLESLTLFLPMARSESVKRTLLLCGETHSESPNSAHLRDCGSRVHRCTVRLPPELDPFQADR